ncbi:MAG: branched-chain amino acid transporter permease [Oscillospiraceae bacterium]|nr:branched-chain amino acid transporter permease [Oscillospiraceae bacterium]
MEQFLQQMINGISIGSIYALVALGYTMVYGIIKLINFAHGDVMMIGAYVGYACVALFNIPFIPSMLIAMVVCSILGVIIERVAYKPLRNAQRITVLITAIGVSFLLEYVMMYFVGATSKTYPQGALGAGKLSLGALSINVEQVYVITTTIIMMIVLQYIIKRTKLGKAMRAVSSDQDAAQLMGISVDRTISFTFILGSSLAAVAGVMLGAMYTISPLMGVQPGLKAFVAAVFGGIGSIPGAMLGGILLGLIETLVSAYLSSSYKDAVAFAILIIVLIVRPAGILGKNVREKV